MLQATTKKKGSSTTSTTEQRRTFARNAKTRDRRAMVAAAPPEENHVDNNNALQEQNHHPAAVVVVFPNSSCSCSCSSKNSQPSSPQQRPAALRQHCPLCRVRPISKAWVPPWSRTHWLALELRWALSLSKYSLEANMVSRQVDLVLNLYMQFVVLYQGPRCLLYTV